MLQQILRDMYIDPELLAELDEEQKQVLFCKMREEQVRKWEEREKKLAKEEKNKKHKLKIQGNKHVEFVTGKDGKEWVWVMGEHADDKSIEQILEEEAQRKAELLAEKEVEELRLKEEEAIKKKLKEEEEKLIVESKLQKEEENLKRASETCSNNLEEEQILKFKAIKRKHEFQRRQSVEQIEKHKSRRSSELYMSFKEARQQLVTQAEANKHKIDEQWEQQEIKAKKAEAEQRDVARRARDEHRKSLQTKAQVVGVLMSSFKSATNLNKPPLPAKPVPSFQNTKPTSRKSVIDWFKTVERFKGSGMDPQTSQVAAWFHGIVSRQDAEDLLESEPVGSYLVRVSERIWGYAISYRAAERCKHFLIDTACNSYQFFGTNQIAHESLADLVHFHQSKPISSAGQELLIYPSAQKCEPPDYADLFAGDYDENSYL